MLSLSPVSLSYSRCAESFHVKVQIAANPLAIRLWHNGLPGLFQCDPSDSSDSIRYIIAASWWVIDGIFSTSATAAFKTAELGFQFLNVQKFYAFACEDRNRSEIQL